MQEQIKKLLFTKEGDDVIIVLVVLRGSGLKRNRSSDLIIFPEHNIACKISLF